MLFSERYKELIHTGEGTPADMISGEVSYDVKMRLSCVMLDFCEPQKIKPDRYDSYTVETDALDIAIEELNDALGFSVLNSAMIWSPVNDEKQTLSNLSTPYLFDLIELQYKKLSDTPENGKQDFRTEINSVFQSNDQPWQLVDGRLVKIDAKQFELDVKRKTLERLQELKDASPVYQSAFDELTKAVKYLDRGEYTDAIINAAKSYESILKVVCNIENGNADKLTQRFVNDALGSLPGSTLGGGLKEKVLMSLPYIRNNAAAHGGGSNETPVSRSLANLAVNLAASLDTFIIEETKK